MSCNLQRGDRERRRRRIVVVSGRRCPCLLGAGVLRHCLGTLGYGVFGKLAGQQEANGSLDFATGYRRASVVVSQTRGLCSDALEDVVDEAVHDRHRLAADASIRMYLLENLVDVDGIALPSSPLALLVSSANGFRLAGSLLRSLASWLRWHFVFFVLSKEQRIMWRTASRPAFIETTSLERSRDALEIDRPTTTGRSAGGAAASRSRDTSIRPL